MMWNRLHITEKWAKEHPHSGSRMDYWPHLFHDVNEEVPGKGFIPRLKSCSILPGIPEFIVQDSNSLGKIKNMILQILGIGMKIGVLFIT